MRMKIQINKIVKYLVLSDLVFWAGWGLITPVFAIFIVDRIQGGTAFVVGIASAIYWILKSILRIPIGMFLDKTIGERDDYWFLTVGLFMAAFVPFGYAIATLPWHIYMLQVFYAIGMAMSLSGWTAIFTRHIDKGKEATEWGIDATSVGLGAGISAAIGGWAVTQFGFALVLITVGILGLIGASILFLLRDEIKGVFDHGLHFSLKDILGR
ncbi:MAG: hypothetical protein CO144_00430 [Candidatus Nealsonbacteria bacterium CG_4_9_14_3_um_filter_35_11]|nr:MAG: hypothetical protein CO144_00430 [Candidatus Nealsonbacteria bacterium CG_4_9_14_3_um_filter_35_11]